MKQKPKYWEIVCKHCMGGFRMSDEEVKKRLERNSETLWPKHCGQTMCLRHIVYEAPKEQCDHIGCWTATNGLCHCSCRGKNHGAMNPNPSYTNVKVKEPAWYKIPIKSNLNISLIPLTK